MASFVERIEGVRDPPGARTLRALVLPGVVQVRSPRHLFGEPYGGQTIQAEGRVRGVRDGRSASFAALHAFPREGAGCPRRRIARLRFAANHEPGGVGRGCVSRPREAGGGGAAGGVPARRTALTAYDSASIVPGGFSPPKRPSLERGIRGAEAPGAGVRAPSPTLSNGDAGLARGTRMSSLFDAPAVAAPAADPAASTGPWSGARVARLPGRRR